MYNETYDDYIRSILGYPPMNSYNNYQEYGNKNINYETRQNTELESCYPEIYKIVYPMISKKCDNVPETLTNQDIENMTDEIYYALEERNEIQLNINLTNEVRTAESTNDKLTKVANKKPEVKIRESLENKGEKRQFNSGLRDLIKILLIRELLNRHGRPPKPRPPMPGPRPPVRPPMRPPFGPGPGRIPFNREFDTLNYDIFEY